MSYKNESFSCPWNETLFLYLCVHSLSCAIKWHVTFKWYLWWLLILHTLIAGILELYFSYEKNFSNIKSYPLLAQGIPSQLTLGNAYLTIHIGVEFLAFSAEKMSHGYIDIYWYSSVKKPENITIPINWALSTKAVNKRLRAGNSTTSSP